LTPPAFHGLIQHSFALRLPKKRQPLANTNGFRQVQKLFALPGNGGSAFQVKAVGADSLEDEARMAQIAEHSPLVRSGETTVHPLSIRFSGATGRCSDPDLPPAFGWAGTRGGNPDPRQDGPTFVFGKVNPSTGKGECNDYLVERSGCGSEARSISWSLLEILAHKRSRLLGLALANRIVSVMLPHAVLTPTEDSGSSTTSSGSDRSWFVQPLLSFIRDGQVKTKFRDSYSLTLLLVPVDACGYGDREMTAEEIDWTVNAGWGLAAVPTRKRPPRFQARGPLCEYLTRFAAPLDPATLLWPPEGDSAPGAGVDGGSFTLRQGTEVLAFCLALKLAQGATGNASQERRHRIGDDVVTSLGSARVSSVLVVDDDLTVKKIREEDRDSLQNHRGLMVRLARETRPPNEDEYGKFRLDRPFVDDSAYVVGVVPTKRCIVVSCARNAQYGWYQSGLMQAGSITHMTIGAATALGTLCAIDRDLEKLEAEDPSKIADIDDEIATDLREIYDLDITSESYRRLYRLLRKRLGVIRDYKALEEKMEALYRATSTRHEIKAQRQLYGLTVVIGVLTLLIVVVDVIK
jgi:hypothetical protein